MNPFAVGNLWCCLLVALLASGLSLTVVTGCAPTGVYHTIEPGQTLYRIARAYDIPEAELARINRIHDPTRLQVGHKLYIPGATRLRQVPVPPAQRSARPAAPPQTVTQAPKVSPPPSQVRQKTPPPPKKSPPTTAQPAKKKGDFVWPIKGKVVRQFGTSQGAATKGIEISCREGEPVHAAAPGKVIYSGNSIRGYGHLIIVEHADDFFTVYGYNQQNLAKANDYVGQGDRIASCGKPPSAGSSRLHFEVRKGKQAVNPIFYLP